MHLSTLTAISPLDGRYYDKLTDLSPVFSEYGLMTLRLTIEIAWIRALSEEQRIQEVPPLSKDANRFLDDILENFNEYDAEGIKVIEHTTQHDVKAVEYFLKGKFQTHSELKAISEFVHFACTSEDIGKN